MNDLTSRRTFLGSTAVATTGLAGALAARVPWLHALAKNPVARQERILVVIQLTGGNDGLNTVIPYADEEYRRARPKLAIPYDEVIKLDETLGFHPSLGGVARLFESKCLSIIQGVGYAAPNRSHFESMDIWHTCQFKSQRSGDGWLGRYLAEVEQQRHRSSAEGSCHRGEHELSGMHFGNEPQPLALSGRGVQVPSIGAVEQFQLRVAQEGLVLDQAMTAMRQSDRSREQQAAPALLEFLESTSATAISASQRINELLSKTSDSGRFPQTGLGSKLEAIARLITAGIATRIYYVTLDGFDTHALQPETHAILLRQWSDALAAFVDCLQEAGEAERVLVMTFSEFGRRVSENASLGTDHGAAAPVFLAGPSLDRAIVGPMPSLVDLDDGDQKYHTDFRQVYATLIDGWFRATNASSVLGGDYQPLAVFKND
jgi:uncharacterized protein (DUF1501 family)